jgi:protein PhnA
MVGPGRSAGEEQGAVRDANGNLLQDGDTVTVIKDLKVKGFAGGQGGYQG